MTRRTVAGVLLVALGALTGSAGAQTRPAAIGMARPTGGQRGTTVTVVIDGSNLAEPARCCSTSRGSERAS